MNKELIQGLANKYAAENLDFFKAVRTWKENRLSPDAIKAQVQFDINKRISAVDARELYHFGSAMKSDYEMIAKSFDVSAGREDLIPDNIKQDKIKLSPAIKQSMERVGQNLFLDRKAKKYWTLKEKVGDDGSKAVYLVAVEEVDEMKKQAADTDFGDAGLGNALKDIRNQSQWQNNQGIQEVTGNQPPQNTGQESSWLDTAKNMGQSAWEGAKNLGNQALQAGSDLISNVQSQLANILDPATLKGVVDSISSGVSIDNILNSLRSQGYDEGRMGELQSILNQIKQQSGKQ